MGTTYFTAYERAITEFKDPTLKKMLVDNTILFNEIMYNFLENAIDLFTNPIEVIGRLADRTLPETFNNEFISDGVTVEFVLTNYPSELQSNNTIWEVTNNNIQINGSYNPLTFTYTIDAPQPLNDVININGYYVGEWNIELYPRELYIVSQFILACWSEYVSNDKLDIVRLLGDTDFKLQSNSATTTAKSNWNIVNRETVVKRMNKYAWDSVYLEVYR